MYGRNVQLVCKAYPDGFDAEEATMTAMEVPIVGGSSTTKLRDPIGVALLDLVTLGVYGFVWYYRVHRELAELGRARGSAALGQNPKRSLLAVFPGFLLVVPLVMSFWNAPRRVAAAERLVDESDCGGVNMALAFILLLLLFPAGAGYLQSHLNRVWATQDAVREPAAQPEDSELVMSS
jgi:hypothetical protein